MLMKKKSQQKNTNEQTSQHSQPSKQKNKKSMATLRLQKDLVQYHKQQISFVKLSFPDQDSLQLIKIQVIPQQPSLYANCKVTFQLEFPDSYPMDPPKLLCLNRVYHPNINFKGGVCLPLVRQDFTPTVTLMSIICGLIFIMTYPNADDALNPEIGDLMAKDYQMFKKIVSHTVQGRSFQNKDYDKISLSTKENL